MDPKLKELLTSRKFWTLALALAVIGVAYFHGNITSDQAINALVAAGVGYTLGTGIESGLQGKS